MGCCAERVCADVPRHCARSLTDGGGRGGQQLGARHGLSVGVARRLGIRCAAASAARRVHCHTRRSRCYRGERSTPNFIACTLLSLLLTRALRSGFGNEGEQGRPRAGAHRPVCLAAGTMLTPVLPSHCLHSLWPLSITNDLVVRWIGPIERRQVERHCRGAVCRAARHRCPRSQDSLRFELCPTCRMPDRTALTSLLVCGLAVSRADMPVFHPYFARWKGLRLLMSLILAVILSFPSLVLP